MHAAGDRPEFAPPPQPGLLRAFVLAVIAHLLLVLALMHGLQWQRESENAVAEAELWSAVPREAAPREVPVPPPPAPVVKAPPQPEPPPVVKAPPPEPPVQRDADIALEREKEKREAEKRRLAEEREERRKLEARKQREEELAQKKREEELARKKREEEIAKKKQEQAKLLAEAKRKEQEAREAREAKRLAELREQNLRRIQGMAGTGAPGSTGSAAQSSGPSASWGAKVQARVRPNIVFTGTISGNPKADVEVRTSPDGTIVGKRLVRSSGNKAWDDAVLRALDRTESLPRDVDGRVPTPVVIGFSPKA